MEDKKWYLSRTIWGVVISMLGKLIAAVAGYEISAADTAQVTDAAVLIAGGVASLFGDIMAIRGRVKATTTISTTTDK